MEHHLPPSWGPLQAHPELLFAFLFLLALNIIDGGGGLVAKSCPNLATPWTVAHKAPLSMGFSRQEYWGGLPFPPPEDLPKSYFICFFVFLHNNRDLCLIDSWVLCASNSARHIVGSWNITKEGYEWMDEFAPLSKTSKDSVMSEWYTRGECSLPAHGSLQHHMEQAC